MVKEKQSSSAEPDGARLPPLPQPLQGPWLPPLERWGGTGLCSPWASCHTSRVGPPTPFPVRGCHTPRVGPPTPFPVRGLKLKASGQAFVL